MLCDRKQSGFHPEASAAVSSVKLVYYGNEDINLRGPITGQTYEFSRFDPIQAVDSRDAIPFLDTRIFRVAQ